VKDADDLSAIDEECVDETSEASFRAMGDPLGAVDFDEDNCEPADFVLETVPPLVLPQFRREPFAFERRKEAV